MYILFLIILFSNFKKLEKGVWLCPSDPFMICANTEQVSIKKERKRYLHAFNENQKKKKEKKRKRVK